MAEQLDLPLETETKKRFTFYKAWARSGMKLPYDRKMREREISNWLRNLAETLRNGQEMKHSG
jgi:hypothetical protein